MQTNPYVAGPPVLNPHFYGRNQLLDELTDPRYTCYYLVGTRRVGKTSLLKVLGAKAPENAIPLFVNLQRAMGRGGQLDEKRFVRILKREAKLQGKGKLDNAISSSELLDLIESLAWEAEENDN